MKKISKKGLVILFAALLFLSPVSTAYAASAPVLVYTYDTGDETFKLFEFQPDPYLITAGNGAILRDTTNYQLWKVPAERAFYIQVDLASQGSFTVNVYRQEASLQLVYSETRTGYWDFFSCNIDPISYDASYLVVITAATTNNIYVHSYTGITYYY